MRVLVWFIRGVLFVVLLGLAIKNSADVELRFYFDARWLAPLSLVILIAFVAGILTGMLAVVPYWVRQRRSMGRLERRLAANGKPVAREASSLRDPSHGN